MTDITTKKPIRVAVDSTIGPYVDLPVSQLDEVQRLLDDRRVAYRIRENAISWDGGPEMTVIYFGRGGDATVVQEILDGVR